MKRSNPNMNKPSTNKINNQLSRYKCNTKSKLAYINICRKCGKEFTFYEKDLKDQVIKCPDCGFEEIFFRCNFS